MVAAKSNKPFTTPLQPYPKTSATPSYFDNNKGLLTTKSLKPSTPVPARSRPGFTAPAHSCAKNSKTSPRQLCPPSDFPTFKLCHSFSS